MSNLPMQNYRTSLLRGTGAMMAEIDGAFYALTRDWSAFDAGEVVRQGDADDEAFERWLASLSPDAFDLILSDLHHDADALLGRTG
jgi:hypothetical protein